LIRQAITATAEPSCDGAVAAALVLVAGSLRELARGWCSLKSWRKLILKVLSRNSAFFSV
jgi:hypothetical protein